MGRAGLFGFYKLAVLLKFMEYCEPEPVDYSTMSDEELMERAIAAGLDSACLSAVGPPT
jgi:hypothetical protein